MPGMGGLLRILSRRTLRFLLFIALGDLALTALRHPLGGRVPWSSLAIFGLAGVLGILWLRRTYWQKRAGSDSAPKATDGGPKWSTEDRMLMTGFLIAGAMLLASLYFLLH